MVKLFCAVVGEAGSAFPVDIDEGQSVGDLKKAIKGENSDDPTLRNVAPKNLQLFLAKKEKGAGAWLTQLEVQDGVSDTSDYKHLRFPDPKLGAVGLASGQLGEVSDEEKAAGKGPVHVLVVAPEAGTPLDTDGLLKFSDLVDLSVSGLKYEGGVPSSFATLRETTVASIASLLDRTSVVFVRAPPLSGKTAMCDLLNNYIVRSNPGALVCRVRANRMAEGDMFADYFKLLYGCTFEVFSALKGNRVVLIDEAQITYNDVVLWRGYVKDTLDSQIRGLRFVLFSSYGSFNVYREHERAGTPILIPPQSIVGLNATPSKPGLQLSRGELDEMIENSNFASVSDLIWILCSGHIGIARAILLFLSCKFGSKTTKAEDAEMELRSVGLLQYIRFSYRGIPTAEAFLQLKTSSGLSEESILKMGEVMDVVASGKVMLVSDGQRTPRSQTAVVNLTKFGFLYEDQTKQLQFASNMHLKIWLHSNRTEPIGYMVSDISRDEFVVACVKRMSASRLQSFATENASSIARERQIQMELYRATTSCLPTKFMVIPEWHTKNGKGFIDLVIQGSDILWFWELLVNGDDAVGHSKRFETGGKYASSLTGRSRYVLIDFRQNKGVRLQKDGFLYVTFADSYSKALVFGSGKPNVSVELSR